MASGARHARHRADTQSIPPILGNISNDSDTDDVVLCAHCASHMSCDRPISVNMWFMFGLVSLLFVITIILAWLAVTTH